MKRCVRREVRRAARGRSHVPGPGGRASGAAPRAVTSRVTSRRGARDAPTSTSSPARSATPAATSRPRLLDSAAASGHSRTRRIATHAFGDRVDVHPLPLRPARSTRRVRSPACRSSTTRTGCVSITADFNFATAVATRARCSPRRDGAAWRAIVHVSITNPSGGISRSRYFRGKATVERALRESRSLVRDPAARRCCSAARTSSSTSMAWVLRHRARLPACSADGRYRHPADPRRATSPISPSPRASTREHASSMRSARRRSPTAGWSRTLARAIRRAAIRSSPCRPRLGYAAGWLCSDTGRRRRAHHAGRGRGTDAGSAGDPPAARRPSRKLSVRARENADALGRQLRHRAGASPGSARGLRGGELVGTVLRGRTRTPVLALAPGLHAAASCASPRLPAGTVRFHHHGIVTDVATGPVDRLRKIGVELLKSSSFNTAMHPNVMHGRCRRSTTTTAGRVGRLHDHRLQAPVRLGTVGGEAIVYEIIIGLSRPDYADAVFTIDDEGRIVESTASSTVIAVELRKLVPEPAAARQPTGDIYIERAVVGAWSCQMTQLLQPRGLTRRSRSCRARAAVKNGLLMRCPGSCATPPRAAVARSPQSSAPPRIALRKSYFAEREQAGADLAVGGEPDAVAVPAEGPRDRGDHAHRAAAVEIAIERGGGARIRYARGARAGTRASICGRGSRPPAPASRAPRCAGSRAASTR